ncbi:MAG: hypothetical protein HY361_02970 [Candidatus Aenigmarchaeota archaeon]|nr:hypothetical protein [Candidatus Aenigmarchaeota archaeon]
MRTTGYVAACLTNGEYVQLGPFRRKLQAYGNGKKLLPVFEIIHVNRRSQRVVVPFSYGYANPNTINYDDGY